MKKLFRTLKNLYKIIFIRKNTFCIGFDDYTYKGSPCSYYYKFKGKDILKTQIEEIVNTAVQAIYEQLSIKRN